METRTEICKQLHTVRDYLRWAVSQFTRANLYFGHGTDNAHDDALQLIFHTLHLPLDADPSILDGRLTMEERNLVMIVLETRLHDCMPVPYLTGEAWFAGMPFTVDERVLIPRSPIAEMIENGFAPWLQKTPERILDLCTGSGCIGIACAHYFEDAQVELADISSDALAVAAMNIERHDLSDRVAAIQSDLFADLSGGYDLIVTNPPYVGDEEYSVIPKEYQHEPKLALVTEHNGLRIAENILHQAADFLTENGLLVLEVGNSDLALQQRFPAVPFTWIEFERGGHGVLAITREELIQYRDDFAARDFDV